MVDMRYPFDPVVDPGIVFDDPSLTHQSFADECDYNCVMARWERTGVIDHLNAKAPQYIDVVGIGDYQTALNTVLAAQDSFAALPSVVRDRFANDPAALLRFLEDPANLDEAVKLGLAVGKSERPQEAGEELSTAKEV